MIAEGASHWVLACLDASTGECLIGPPLEEDRLIQELESLPIRHLLRSTDRTFTGFEKSNVLIETLPSNYLSLPQAEEVLKRHYGVQHLDAYLTSRASTLALGMLVTYALRTQQRETLPHLRVPAPLHKPQTLILGPRAAQHLDLLPSADGTPNLFTHQSHALSPGRSKSETLAPFAPQISRRDSRAPKRGSRTRSARLQTG